MMDQLLRARGRSPFDLRNPQTPDRDGGVGSGAHAAAGVLTAVDEDGEGDEEAPVPDEFEYFSDEANDSD